MARWHPLSIDHIQDWHVVFAVEAFCPGCVGPCADWLGYYVVTFLGHGRLSLATIFLLSASVTIFLIGLVSEQMTALMYKDSY